MITKGKQYRKAQNKVEKKKPPPFVTQGSQLLNICLVITFRKVSPLCTHFLSQ